MKLLNILFVLVLLTVPLFAQSEKVEWKQLSEVHEEFNLKIPKSNFAANYIEDNGKIVSALYRAKVNDTYFFIKSSLEKQYLPLNDIENLAKENGSASIKTTLGNLLGTKYHFKDKEGFYNHVITLSTTKRYYLFHALSEKQNDKLISQFFDSIEFSKSTMNGFPPKDTSALARFAEKLKSKHAAKEKSKPKSGIGTGLPYKKGKIDIESIITNTKNSKLRLYSKPSPNYTDLARLYHLNGSVLLRVAFTKKGEVNSIEALKKLPLGLTNKAIEAARGITFVPPVMDGKPYTVYKRIQYNFTVF